jgi:hypothetical protein
MAMKDKFAPHEWHLLKLLPFLTFNYVLAALAPVKQFELDDPKYLESLLKGLVAAQSSSDRLLREVAADTTPEDWETLFAESMDPTRIDRSVVQGDAPDSDGMLMLMSRILAARNMLDDKLIKEQYHSYLSSVVQLAAIAPFQDVHKKARGPAYEAVGRLIDMLRLDLMTFASFATG